MKVLQRRAPRLKKEGWGRTKIGTSNATGGNNELPPPRLASPTLTSPPPPPHVIISFSLSLSQKLLGSITHSSCHISEVSLEVAAGGLVPGAE